MVSYSDHEGFGVPLVEAMHIGMAIIAKQTSALPYTLGGHGLLVKNKSELTAALTKVASDKEYFHEIIAKQKERLQHFTTANVKKCLHKNCKRLAKIMFGPEDALHTINRKGEKLRSVVIGNNAVLVAEVTQDVRKKPMALIRVPKDHDQVHFHILDDPLD